MTSKGVVRWSELVAKVAHWFSRNERWKYKWPLTYAGLNANVRTPSHCSFACSRNSLSQQNRSKILRVLPVNGSLAPTAIQNTAIQNTRTLEEATVTYDKTCQAPSPRWIECFADKKQTNKERIWTTAQRATCVTTKWQRKGHYSWRNHRWDLAFLQREFLPRSRASMPFPAHTSTMVTNRF